MKSFPKIIKAIFLIIFILQVIGLIFLLASPNLSRAENMQVNFIPQVTVGTFTANEPVPIKPTSIGLYIREIYQYAIGIVGILAAVVLMVGGIIWLTAGGNQTRIGEAKSWIGASLTGLIIALCSYLILATVNPELVNIKSINPEPVTALGCCQLTGNTCGSFNMESCTQKGGSWSGSNKTCNNMGNCVSSVFVCCLTASTCSFTEICGGTILNRRDCCSNCTISWYKNNIDNSINTCSDIPEFTGGAEGDW